LGGGHFWKTIEVDGIVICIFIAFIDYICPASSKGAIIPYSDGGVKRHAVIFLS
jgi:hypothetical protein